MVTRWWTVLLLAFLVGTCLAQDGEDASGSGSGSGDGEEEALGEVGASGSGDGESGDGAEDGEASGDGETTEEETDGEASGSGDDVDSILALGGEASGDASGEASEASGEGDSGSGSGSGDEPAEAGGADALAEALGGQTCDKDGMDPKVAECFGSLESQISDLMTSVMGPDGGEGTLEDKITLVLVKKGVISCENETQCDDNKQCLKQPDGMSRCQDPCERPEVIRCDVPFSYCLTEDHTPRCECKEDFHGNATEVCIPLGFDTEDNKRGYRMFDEEYLEWENATQKCQELGARLPVLSDKSTIKIVKKYLDTADFDVFEQWDRSSRRVWLGLKFEPSAGLVWVDDQRVIAYPASSRLFVWESRRLLAQEVAYADNSRHYGFYIDGDIAKLPGGGRRGAAVLCELLPDQLAEDPNPHDPYAQAQPDTYGQNQADPYGQNQQNQYGRNQQDQYGRNQHDQYGRNPQDQYGRNQQDPYGSPARQDPYYSGGANTGYQYQQPPYPQEDDDDGGYPSFPGK